MKKNREILDEQIDKLTNELNSLRPEALKRSSKILNRDVNVHSLHGIIGGKNNSYVDSVRTQFVDFNDFFTRWIAGLNNMFEVDREEYIKRYDSFDWSYKGSFRAISLMRDEKVFEYTEKFLERNFYKYLHERIRMKPHDSLWSLWFGYKLSYGLLIAPKRLADDWSVDISHIRKTNYNYWTIGHVMATGLIDNELSNPIQFTNINDLLNFCQSVLKRLSNSTYEQQIYDIYIQYLRSSAKIYEEPFLIPEFRYAGLKKNHEHRLDFTILNSHTNDFIGYEISPASTHMSVTNLKKKQFEVNLDLKVKWEKEMSKRNKYFDSFGITTFTFTDEHLKNIEQCFKVIQEKLSDRGEPKLLLSQQIDRLNSF